MPEGRDIEALIAFIESRECAGFDWRGKRDCVAFAAGAVEALTGAAPLGDLAWDSRKAALALIKAEGGLVAALDRRFDRVAPALARRGDIAAVHDPKLEFGLAILEGATLVGPGKEGNFRLPREAMLFAWEASSFRAAPTDEGAA